MQTEQLGGTALAFDHPTTLFQHRRDVTALELAQGPAAGLERRAIRDLLILVAPAGPQPTGCTDGTSSHLLERVQIYVVVFRVYTGNDALKRQTNGLEQLCFCGTGTGGFERGI